MTNSEIREWYLAQVATIAGLDSAWTKQGVPLEERARRAWKIRHDARLRAREMMPKREAALLKVRDFFKYQSSSGPTFEQLVAEGQSDGLSVDETFQRIISGAQRTNKRADRRRKKPKK